MMTQSTILGRARWPPELVYSQGTNYNTTQPFTVTIGQAPIAGSLMVLCVGTNQARTFSYPAGWTQVLQSGIATGSLEFAYKFAVSGESTSVNITWGAGTTVGQVYYLEIAGQFVPPTLQYGGTGVSQGSATTHAYGSHNIPRGTFAIEQIRCAIGVAVSSVNDSYTLITTGGVHSVAYKRYINAQDAVNMTWTCSGATIAELGIMGFIGI